MGMGERRIARLEINLPAWICGQRYRQITRVAKRSQAVEDQGRKTFFGAARSVAGLPCAAMSKMWH